MGHARRHVGAQGWSKGLISYGFDKPRIREDNNGKVIVPKEPSLLGKYYGRMELNYLENYVQKGTILLRIHIKESSQQQRRKYLGRRLSPPH